jgi:putative effector of murein hydrolase LrgA (UPF0299 family)
MCAVSPLMLLFVPVLLFVYNYLAQVRDNGPDLMCVCL